jgi:hypothetical protein
LHAVPDLSGVGMSLLGWLGFRTKIVWHVTEVGMIFTRRLQSRDHVRAFVVDEADARGWEVREEEDHRVVRRAWLHDWHRVEHAVMRFGLVATQLEQAGWTELESRI